ncbi:winged helix-turn-helix transcriptional regulator [candidate division KSB1 bacterium]|nr:winged helix-turn-helix transcriptional regulator [candidate division KSB1 bacterium]
MDDLAAIFKALSEPNRIRILKMLEIRPLCVCEITAVLDLAVSTVSKHLSILKACGLIYDVCENKWVIYHLNRRPGSKYVREISQLLKNWLADSEIVAADRRKVNRVDRNMLCRK